MFIIFKLRNDHSTPAWAARSNSKAVGWQLGRRSRNLTRERLTYNRRTRWPRFGNHFSYSLPPHCLRCVARTTRPCTLLARPPPPLLRASARTAYLAVPPISDVDQSFPRSMMLLSVAPPPDLPIRFDPSKSKTAKRQLRAFLFALICQRGAGLAAEPSGKEDVPRLLGQGTASARSLRGVRVHCAHTSNHSNVNSQRRRGSSLDDDGLVKTRNRRSRQKQKTRGRTKQRVTQKYK